MTALSADGIAVIYDRTAILQDVTLDVVAGELLALVGPNGAGKSTLLGVLSGDVNPTHGSVTLDGRPLTDHRAVELARHRAVLTQENLVSFPFRVGEVIEMGRAPWARTPSFEDDEAAVAEAVAATDVGHLLTRRITSLSGGEKARVALARVLAQHTPIVFLDEPTAALDLRHQEDVMRTARSLADAGRAVVVVLHDLSLAGAYADRIALVSSGRLVATGSPHDVLTADRIGEIYGLRVQVLLQDDRPVVLPVRG
ncbi:MAG: heme ABC transporter ATP-binding protein [Microbacteriaceae bacterium]